jgi:hypothetical protein
VKKSPFKVIFDFKEQQNFVDINTLSECVMNYLRVGQDDPNSGESRCENPKIKCQ